MRTSEIRTRWLEYFEQQGHEIRPSVSLVSPEPSILFTIAGMVPFIPYITGVEPAPWPRAASVQKCIRTNDIDNVGKTTRHGTFFQMNGNFSFGDYFKEGAIDYAWELLTTPQAQGGYGLDGDRLWMTIWEKDEVSFTHWTKTIGVDPERVQRLPFEEISWSTGQPGPAGACCEIHYDRGPQYGPDGGPIVDVAGDRFLEIWNLVFDEFVRGEGEGHDFELVGTLDKTAIDTGAGLERLAFIMQDKPNMYEIDEVFPVIAAAQEMSGKTYGLGAEGPSAGNAYEDDVRLRVVADHVRSALMLIGDGVRPGNDGRGYVLRRLVRRAVRSMRLLGVNEAAMPTLLTASKDAMKASYPELETNWKTISEVAYAEEDAFRRTLSAGTTILDTAVASAKETKGAPVISGASAFSLHDTYGFPIDLTLEMAAEQGVAVDEEGFRTLMAEQKERARADARAKKTGHTDVRVFRDIEKEMGGGSTFLGYTEQAAEATVQALLVGGVAAPAASAPAEVEVVLDRTPFYAEMGGQLADHGVIRLAGGGVVEVNDVQAPIRGLNVHRGTLTEGGMTVGEKAYAQIDGQRRLDIARAHTATHMVYAGLRSVVSEDATQAGSENSPSRLRFDFRHSSALEGTQLGDIEALVNEKLAEDLAVTTEVMSIDQAKATGAIALFGEKYGAQVRVVTIGDGFDRELCGGTHVPTTGHIGRITVLGEGSIGSGVRRIDALVGDGAYEFQAKEHALVAQLSQLVGGRPNELPERIETLLAKLRDSEKELEKIRTEQALSRGADLATSAERVGQVSLVAADVGVMPAADALRTLALDVRDRMGNERGAVVALGGLVGGKPSLVVATNEGAREQSVKAGALVRAVGKHMGGGGGGRDDIAQGGGAKPEGIAAAIDAIRNEIEAL
ncbi:alanyl-tRNA synthetase [Schaalia meyeri]|uniref:Alanine--tRNA ligase n=1 Tax=Schaalia meyeri TaxID=52773 RepID=A0AAP9Y812_9ACTO|nr:alanine--tRNA ligase [Schaalia meyeri]AKU64840.1 alanyl-tRNA synthetase [Schaalia meyeri]OFQ24371.1 alanine--tRNA ligase [Actinomyces sp. HMSC062G12]QQC44492.1 alanine--tRNA ligase [Schaalia meyeri]SDR64661.1 alanyl-tRNA synthetase [Schaalia meyeri]